jgi:rhodanese-related sulfurtransferase
MEPMAVKKGDEVVRQGEKGDAYYLITAGRAEVWECGLYDDTPVKVNEIKAGDAFGEHALLVGGSRSATVRMVEEGSMLVLREADFQSLISAPMLNEVAPDMAKALIDAGYEALDVRYREERDESYIPGSFLIPLHELRHRFSEFRTGNKYLVYCQSGKRAAVATLLLNQHHFDAVSLRGGLRDWPYEVQRAD